MQSSTQSILASMIVVSFIFRTFQDIVFHLHVRFAMNTTKLDGIGIAILFNVVSMTFPWILSLTHPFSSRSSGPCRAAPNFRRQQCLVAQGTEEILNGYFHGSTGPMFGKILDI